jgi:hypothetical protein
VVHAQELAEQLLMSPPRVRTQLLAFVDSGVMRLLPRSGHIQNYERLDDPVWMAVIHLIEGWIPEAEIGRGLRTQWPRF